jgi:hypothetical protein
MGRAFDARGGRGLGGETSGEERDETLEPF